MLQTLVLLHKRHVGTQRHPFTGGSAVSPCTATAEVYREKNNDFYVVLDVFLCPLEYGPGTYLFPLLSTLNQNKFLSLYQLIKPLWFLHFLWQGSFAPFCLAMAAFGTRHYFTPRRPQHQRGEERGP